MPREVQQPRRQASSPTSARPSRCGERLAGATEATAASLASRWNRRPQGRRSARTRRPATRSGWPQSAVPGARGPSPLHVAACTDATLRLLAYWPADRVQAEAVDRAAQRAAGVPRPARAWRATCCARTRTPARRSTSGYRASCSTSSRTPTRSRSSSRSASPGERRSSQRLARADAGAPARSSSSATRSSRSTASAAPTSRSTSRREAAVDGRPATTLVEQLPLRGQPVIDWVNEVFGQLIQPSTPGAASTYEPLVAQPRRRGWARRRRSPSSACEAEPEGRRRRAPRARGRRRRRHARPELSRELDDLRRRRRGAGPAAHRPTSRSSSRSRTRIGCSETRSTPRAFPIRAESSVVGLQAPRGARPLITAARDRRPVRRARLRRCAALSAVRRAATTTCGAGRRRRGRVDLFAQAKDDALADGPCRAPRPRLPDQVAPPPAGSTPSEVLARLIEDRRVLELAVHRRARATRGADCGSSSTRPAPGRRSPHGGLRSYLGWAAMQAQETGARRRGGAAREDIDAVRVMTVHAAKGLEFPIVILRHVHPTQARVRRPAAVDRRGLRREAPQGLRDPSFEDAGGHRRADGASSSAPGCCTSPPLAHGTTSWSRCTALPGQRHDKRQDAGRGRCCFARGGVRAIADRAAIERSHSRVEFLPVQRRLPTGMSGSST